MSEKAGRILEGVIVDPVDDPGVERVLTVPVVQFLAKLAREFEGRRQELLQKRVERQSQIDAGKMPVFLSETKEVRDRQWKVAPIPADLQDRRVEITGPTDRKMIINALNSGANVFMADFEDSNSPTWSNIIQGQINLNDAVRGNIQLTTPAGKNYKLADKIATLMVRPRGWHLDERHVQIDGKPISAALFDFGVFFFHNVRHLLTKGTGPYFYLPKLESHLEARLWNDVFDFSQKELGIKRGTIKATVLLETILAAFEMNEILYELQHHSAGLNCGRWDYIFSVIKKFNCHSQFVLPDRAQVTMTAHFMRSYSRLLIQTCHKRGIHAMGGMAAQIPIKNDPKANEDAINKVRQDKEREVGDGHDGTWVAHPGLIPTAKEIFDEGMKSPNQIDKIDSTLQITAEDLLKMPEGKITENGLRMNLSIGVQYLASWLSGNGCVPLYNLMEDAATAEISRAQVWQWIRHGVSLEGGSKVTVELARSILHEELKKLEGEIPAEKYEAWRYTLAANLMDRLFTAPKFIPFLTIPAYDYLQD